MAWTALVEPLPPGEAARVLEELLSQPLPPNDYFFDRIEVRGKGFRPIAVTLGGLFSIAGAIVSVVTFDTIRYIITSPQVVSGQGPFALSKKWLEKLTAERSLEAVVVPFNEVPEAGAAEKLLDILKRGAVIVNGVSAELALWFGRNAGVGRLMVYRPEKTNYGYRGVFKYV